MAQTSRLESKLDKALETGEFYEAHQIFRTIYHRLAGQNNYAKLLELLPKGAIKLAKGGEMGSATDLAELYADVLVKTKQHPNKEIFDNIGEILSVLPKRPDEDSDHNRGPDPRNKFIAATVQWSQSVAKKNREKKRGLSDLHFLLGQLLWKEEDYEGARNHLLLSERPDMFARFLIECHKKSGYDSEADMFVALAVLQLLCLHRVRTASTVLQQYMANHPSIQASQPPYELPLINFLCLVIQTIPKKDLPRFTMLVDKYSPSLDRDPIYRKYLDKIAQMFFNVPPPVGNQMGMGGLLGNMFKGLLSGEKKEEPEVFSDSDMETDDDGHHHMEVDEDGYETAEDESSMTPRAQASTSSGSATASAPKPPAKVDQMEDLD